MVGLISKECEVLTLSKPILIKNRFIEDWFQDIENMMQLSLKQNLKNSLNDVDTYKSDLY